jgi:DNA-directed RNA polymerase specialized sigma subunit
MGTRDIRYKYTYPIQDSISEAASSATASGSMGLVSRFLQQKVIRLDEFCHHLETNHGEKGDHHFVIPNQGELLKTLTQIIYELPPPEKIIFSLYYCDELNFREIGEVLGYSEQKVSRLFRDGLKKVAAIVQLRAG